MTAANAVPNRKENDNEGDDMISCNKWQWKDLLW